MLNASVKTMKSKAKFIKWSLLDMANTLKLSHLGYLECRFVENLHVGTRMAHRAILHFMFEKYRCGHFCRSVKQFLELVWLPKPFELWGE